LWGTNKHRQAQGLHLAVIKVGCGVRRAIVSLNSRVLRVQFKEA